MMFTNKELFFNLITERERIRLKKEAGDKPPFTDDIILQECRFCNINRENDKVTRYIRNKYKYSDYLYVNLMIARIINRMDVLDTIYPLDSNTNISDCCEFINSVIDKRIEEGKTYFSSVYMTNCSQDKFVFEMIPEIYGATDLLSLDTCQKVFNRLTSIPGLGNFLANQIVQDAKNTAGCSIYNASDKFQFTCIGPGSKRGISYYYEQNVTDKQFAKYLEMLYKDCEEYFKNNDPLGILPQLDMHNLQNCLCEYGKYVRNIDGITLDHHKKVRKKNVFCNGFQL